MALSSDLPPSADPSVSPAVTKRQVPQKSLPPLPSKAKKTTEASTAVFSFFTSIPRKLTDAKTKYLGKAETASLAKQLDSILHLIPIDSISKASKGRGNQLKNIFTPSPHWKREMQLWFNKQTGKEEKEVKFQPETSLVTNTPRTKGLTAEQHLVQQAIKSFESRTQFIDGYRAVMTTEELFTKLLPAASNDSERAVLHTMIIRWLADDSLNCGEWAKPEITSLLDKFIAEGQLSGNTEFQKLANRMDAMLGDKFAAARASQTSRPSSPQQSQVSLDSFFKNMLNGKSDYNACVRKFANDLTAVNADHFKNLQLTELSGKAWEKDDKAIRAPHVVASTNQCNQLCYFVTNAIENETDPAKRNKLIHFFTDVMQQCKDNKDYHSLVAINAALGGVPELRDNLLFKELSTFANRVQTTNFWNNMVQDPQHQGCIPYLGSVTALYQFLSEGSEKMTPTQDYNLVLAQNMGAKNRELIHLQRDVATPGPARIQGLQEAIAKAKESGSQ